MIGGRKIVPEKEKSGKMTFKNSLKGEKRVTVLFLLVIIILAVGFATTTGLSYYLTREYIVKTAVVETLPLVSKNIYTEIMEDLIEPINISSLMANDAFFIDWVLSGEEDVEEISDYLALIKEEYGFSSTFFVSATTRNYYTPEGILKQISLEDDHDVWYFNFIALGKSTDLDVDTNQADRDSLTVFVNHRLETPDNEFLGVTGVGLRITDISEKLARYQEQYDHQVYFIDGEGLIQIHPDQALIEMKTLMEVMDLGELNGNLLTKSETPQYYEIGKFLRGTAFSIRYFPEFDWYLVVEKDQDASLGLVRDIFWKTILIGIAISLLVAMLIIRLINIFHARLSYQASVDPLTGLLNRRAIRESGERETRLARRYERQFSVLMTDIEDFKSVNEEHGHTVGDAYLKGIAKVFTQSLRDTDLVGRWGGDEFITILISSGADEAGDIAERLRNAIRGYGFDSGRGEISRDIHIGAATYLADDTSFLDLVKEADRNLLESKTKTR